MFLQDIVCQVWLLSYLLSPPQQEQQTFANQDKTATATTAQTAAQNVSIATQEILLASYVISFIESKKNNYPEYEPVTIMAIALTTTIIYKLRTAATASNASNNNKINNDNNSETSTSTNCNINFKNRASKITASVVPALKCYALPVLLTLVVLMHSLEFYAEFIGHLTLFGVSLIPQLLKLHERVLLGSNPMSTYINLYILVELLCCNDPDNSAEINAVAYTHLLVGACAWLFRYDKQIKYNNNNDNDDRVFGNHEANNGTEDTHDERTVATADALSLPPTIVNGSDATDSGTFARLEWQQYREVILFLAVLVSSILVCQTFELFLVLLATCAIGMAVANRQELFYSPSTNTGSNKISHSLDDDVTSPLLPAIVGNDSEADNRAISGERNKEKRLQDFPGLIVVVVVLPLYCLAFVLYTSTSVLQVSITNTPLPMTLNKFGGNLNPASIRRGGF